MRRLVVLGVLSLLAVAFGATIAGADSELTLRVTPSSGIDWRGETIKIEVTGRAEGTSAAIGLCSANLEIPPPSLGAVLDDCTLISLVDPDEPVSLEYHASAARAARCLAAGCVIAYGGVTGIYPRLTFVEGTAKPISFTRVDDVPPQHPDFGMTADPTTGLGVSQLIDVEVLNRNPATATQQISLCLEGIDYLDPPRSQCLTRWSADVAGDIAATIRVSRTIPVWSDGIDCANDGCVLVYVGRGSTAQPFSEVAVVDLEWAPAPRVFTATPTNDLVVGDIIEVEWNAFRTIPADAKIGYANQFVGICTVDAGYDWGYSEAECDGVELDVDQTSGTVEIPVQRFIETSGGTIDCLTYEFGCIIGYSLEYEDVSEYPEGIVLHQAYERLEYRTSIVINDGRELAPAGTRVGVVAHGQPTATGASAFVMGCGYSAGWVLQCDGVGTVEEDFDGDFLGAITMPTYVEGKTATVDCRRAPGCLIVFLVVDDTPAILGGGVAKVVAANLPD